MKLELEYIYDDKVLQFVGSGPHDMDVVSRTFMEIYSDSRHPKVCVYLWDYRLVDLSPITIEEIKANILESADYRAKRNDTCPSVMVTETDFQFGLARMRSLLDAERIALEFHTARSLEEAYAWIENYLQKLDA